MNRILFWRCVKWPRKAAITTIKDKILENTANRVTKIPYEEQVNI